MKPLVSAVVVTGRSGGAPAAAPLRVHPLRPVSSPPELTRSGFWQGRWLDALGRWIDAKSLAALKVLESWRTVPSKRRVITAVERRVASAGERWQTPAHGTAQALQRDSLEECLRALIDQSLAPMDFEILVIDEAASNTKRGLVSRLAADHPQVSFNYLPATGRHGTSTTRHIGWRAAQADLVAFTRDDCVPDRFWLEAGVVAFQRPEADGVVFADGRIEGPRAPMHCNCFVRRAALLEVDGLDVGRLRHRFGAQAFAHMPQATVRRPLPLASAPRAAAYNPLQVASLGAAALGLILRRPTLVLAGAAGWIALAQRLYSRDERTRPGSCARSAGEEAMSPPRFAAVDGLTGKATPTKEMGRPS